MSDSRANIDERLLVERLSEEAEASRPEFSEALHERLCRAVAARRDSPRVPLESRPSRRRLRGWIVAAVAVAAVAVLAAPAVVRQFREYFGESRRAAIAPPAAEVVIHWEAVDELTDSTQEDLGELFEVELNDQPWAGLDHDARLALETLTRQLPFEVSTELAASEP